MLGIELSVASVNFCKTEHRNRDRLSFMVGDAHDLPLGNASCDILINVESSLNYRDQDRFFVEVDRVLRPGGHFLFADYRRAKGMSKLQNRLDRMGYEQVHVEDISAGIANAIELDNPGKQERLKRRIPRLLRGLVAAFTFTGAAGRDEVARFRSGEKRYLCAVLRKPQRADTSLVRPAPERNPAVTA
jgi:SAM-dependent methyltransferase